MTHGLIKNTLDLPYLSLIKHRYGEVRKSIPLSNKSTSRSLRSSLTASNTAKSTSSKSLTDKPNKHMKKIPSRYAIEMQKFAPYLVSSDRRFSIGQGIILPLQK